MRQQPEPERASLASVVVCTHNRAAGAERLLRSLADQSVPSQRYEIVLVDDGCTDETASMCRRLQADVPNLRYVATGIKSGTARARNAGVEAARGDPILFVDDDCIARRDWLEHMLAALESEPLVAGAVAAPRGRYFQLCHNVAEFYRLFPCRKVGYVDWIANANAGFRRSLLEDVGLFRGTWRLAEDTEFLLRARTRGYRPYFEPRAVVTHHTPRHRFGEVLRYSAQHATVTIRLRLRYPELTGTPRLFRSPLLLMLAAPLIALRVTAGVYLSSPRMWRLLHTAPVVYGLKLAWK